MIGFLLAGSDRDGLAALHQFYDLGAKRTANRQAEWRDVVTEGLLTLKLIVRPSPSTARDVRE
jgi:hypothetical protein